jgi:predicted nucleic acid-binding Zn ribbon protein
MPKKVSLKKLIKEEEKLIKQLAEKRQKLKVLRSKLLSEYRKREARFLIAIGRTLLKYGKMIEYKGEKIIALPLKNSAFTKAFKEHREVVELNEDFAKWLKWFNENESENTGEEQAAPQETEGKEGDSGQG